jgi:hypothetical protein
MVRILAVVFVCLSLPATGLGAQQPEPPLDGAQLLFQDSLLDRLTGAWSMSGAVRGRPAALTLSGVWVLNHQFLRLEMRDVNVPPAYQADVYIGYDNASERYVAHWLDNFGGRFSETLGFGRHTGSAIAFVFEYPDGPFHTTFTFDPLAGSWAVLMQDRGPGGAWREFAHYAVQRR